MTHYVFLKPHSGNLKLDNHLQFFCHMTSGVRFSHMPFFFLFTNTIFECWKALLKKTKLEWNETKKCIHINIFTGKCQWWCPLVTFSSMRAYNFTKNRTHHRCFLVKFVKFYRTSFLQKTVGRSSRPEMFCKKGVLGNFAKLPVP